MTAAGNGAFEVRLSSAEKHDASSLADETYALFRKRQGFYPNTLASHLKGKLGEVAVEKWLRASGVEVEAPFRDISQTRREDIRTGGIRLEVKTWDDKTWLTMGRCVRPPHSQASARKPITSSGAR